MKYIKQLKIIFILLAIFAIVFFAFFRDNNARIYGNEVIQKQFSNPDFLITRGVSGYPFQISILPFSFSRKYYDSVNVVSAIFIIIAFITLFFLTKNYLIFVFSPIFLIIAGVFSYENMNYLAYFIFVILLLLYEKKRLTAVQLFLQIIIVNLNPVLFPIIILLCVFYKRSWYHYLFALPINLFFLITQRVYYTPSISHLSGSYPFGYFIFLLLAAMIFILKSNSGFLPYFIGLIIFSFIEWQIIPFVFIIIAFRLKHGLKPHYAFILLVMVLLFSKGMPFGNGNYAHFKFSYPRVYGQFLGVKQMPHRGHIYNKVDDGMMISKVFFPNIGSSKAFYCKSSSGDLLSEKKKILFHAHEPWDEDETGVIILPFRDLLYSNSFAYLIIKTGNWALTHLDAKYLVFDRVSDVFDLNILEPFWIQRMLNKEPLLPHQAEYLWHYTDKLYEYYRDIGSLNTSLFISFFLDDEFKTISAMQRLISVKKNIDTEFILTLMGENKIHDFISKYPYDDRGWFLLWERTEKPLFLKIAILLNKSNKYYKYIDLKRRFSQFEIYERIDPLIEPEVFYMLEKGL